MQFDRVEPLTPAAPPVCVACGRILRGTYWTLQKRSLCSDCGRRLKTGSSAPFESGRFLNALTAGFAAVLFGGGLNWLIASKWDLYVGWLSMLASVLVGVAVRFGSGHRGGRTYQILAVVLSYIATASMFLPILQHRAGGLTLAGMLEPFWILLVAPFLTGIQGLLLWSILGVSLYQAWRVNQSPASGLQGPFALGPTMPPDPSAGV